MPGDKQYRSDGSEPRRNASRRRGKKGSLSHGGAKDRLMAASGRNRGETFKTNDEYSIDYMKQTGGVRGRVVS